MDGIFTLEQLINSKVKIEHDGKEHSVTPDLRIANQEELAYGTRIIAHPAEHSGTTMDYVVSGNTLAPLDLVRVSQKPNSEVLDQVKPSHCVAVLEAMGNGIVGQVIEDVVFILSPEQIKDSTKVRNLIEDQLRKVALFDGFDIDVGYVNKPDVSGTGLSLDRDTFDIEIYAVVMGEYEGRVYSCHYTKYLM